MRQRFPHTITYWPPGQEDQYGNTTFGAPILIKGRWEDRNEKVISAGGDEITSQAVVFVDRDVALQGFLAQNDQTAVADPHATAAASEIKALAIVTDMRSVSKERRAIL